MRCILLDIDDIIKTYKFKIPEKQYNFLGERRWLPLYKDSKIAEEFAYLIGKVMGDGHLSKNFHTIFLGQKEEMKELRYIITNNLLINPNKFKIRCKKAKGISYSLNVYDSLFGRILFCLGAPIGNKTKTNFLIPSWISESKRNSLFFLQGLLEDELSTIKIEKKTHSNKPRLKLSKSVKLLPNLIEFLQQVRMMVEVFDVKCSLVSTKANYKENQNTKDLYFDICRNKENIIRFAKNIGFRAHREKQRMLDECVGILKNTIYVRKPKINIPKIIKLRKAGFIIREISRKVKLNKTSVHRVIKKLL